jgi:molecular chaperone GrpE
MPEHNDMFDPETGTPEEDAQAQAEELTLSDEELVALCKDRVCPVCKEKEEADGERLRALAEMDNFKKRLFREQEEFRKYAAESVLADLLPVLDNLELALEHGARVEACKDVVMGVDMTRKVFLDTLKQHGLTPVGAVGEPFDPELHEAVGEEANADVATGHICSLLQRGYRLKERLLRPAKVIVCKEG